MKRAAVLCLLLLAGCASSSLESLPTAVRVAFFRNQATAIEQAGPSVSSAPPAGMIRKVDISNDGVDDWMIDYERAGFSGWCGTGGCRRQLFVSTADGEHVLAFDHQTFDPPVPQRIGGETVLDIAVHGTICNGFGTTECLRRFVWDDASARFEERPNAKGGARLQGPLLQTVEPDPETIPEAAKAAARATLETCRAAGAPINDDQPPPVLSVPDLNGDGQRDWIVDATFSYCLKDGQAVPPEIPTRVFVTTPDGVTEAYAATNLSYEIDVATRPARFVRIVTGEDCGPFEDKRCPEEMLAWDAATGTLRPAG